ncbi:MAG: PEP-CTERM sorting domain-containing protein [Bryobacteraceae bacterium]
MSKSVLTYTPEKCYSPTTSRLGAHHQILGNAMSLKIRTSVLMLTVAGSLAAVTVGQIDTFEDGTTLGWHVPGPSPTPPANVPNDGPLGAGDAYLELVATGGAGPGGRLAVLNDSRWTGNYLAAGITAVRMDVNNFGPDDLFLRLLFEDFGPPGPPVNLALSATAVMVPANSGWRTIFFPVTPSDLVVDVFGTVTGALTDTNTLRIFHNPEPTFPGPGVGIPLVNATLGVDNITAVVPEPGTMALLFCGLLVLVSRRLLMT